VAQNGADLSLLEANPIVDHRRYTNPGDPNSYATSKIETEALWEAAAAGSNGKWDVCHCNPGDIIGPILSKHQVTGFQGQVGQLLEGTPLKQHGNGRPWMTVDVRDVAKAHVGLLAATLHTSIARSLEAGQHRYLLDTNDKVFRDNLGEHLNAAMASIGMDVDAAIGVDPESSGRDHNKDLIWMRLQLRNDKVCAETGMKFRSLEESLRDTAMALIEIAGLQPRMKANI
jgi:nucleoside-diphosphate-sugar epimerase